LNRKLQKSYDTLCKARHNIMEHIQNNLAHYDISAQILRLTQTADKALDVHLKLVEEGKDLDGLGTGKVTILVFNLNP
jgi:hypothetical protein